MTDKRSVRLSDNFIEFLERACSNYHIKNGKTRLHPWQVAELILKYFKLNNDRYLELMDMQIKNGYR